ncbi:hypothetical protein BY996DRAFT_6450168 [Phakopsora pachyrhizi]|nr:hypothetical protein BY996DRAFT_6450168 [Phakopsora pachyrhizi]
MLPTSSVQPNAVQAPDQKAESHSINSSSEPLNDEKPNESHQISDTRTGTSEGENFVPINLSKDLKDKSKSFSLEFCWAISQPFRSEDDFKQSIRFDSPPGEEEGSRQKQLKASSKAVNSKSSSLVNCQIKSFISITKLSSVVKNGSIRGKLKGAEVDIEGVAIESSSEEEMMSPRHLYRQPQAIRENRNWNSQIKEEHLARRVIQKEMVERTVHIPRIFRQRGAEGDGGLLSKEKASEEEEEEILEKLHRVINCGSSVEGSEDNADERKIYWKARQRKFEEQDGLSLFFKVSEQQAAQQSCPS